MKQFGNPPLSMNLLISEQFFHDPPVFVRISKTTHPPNFFFLGGEEARKLCIMKPVFIKQGCPSFFWNRLLWNHFFIKESYSLFVEHRLSHFEKKNQKESHIGPFCIRFDHFVFVFPKTWPETKLSGKHVRISSVCMFSSGWKALNNHSFLLCSAGLLINRTIRKIPQKAFLRHAWL